LGIINGVICQYRQQLILNTAAMIDVGLLKDAAWIKLDVLSAMHFITEPWRLITPTTIKNCFVKCCILIDHVSDNDDSPVKLTEDEEDDFWRAV
jgi:hypothetical protein